MSLDSIAILIHYKGNFSRKMEGVMETYSFEPEYSVTEASLLRNHLIAILVKRVAYIIIKVK